MKARDLAIVGLGELLWDELPGGRVLGGAPANFAVMAAQLGVHGVIASRVGRDEAGAAARARLGELPVDARFLQEDVERPTGSVAVTFESGQPAYLIRAPAAWDALALTDEWRELAGRADAVCWGTLVQRDAGSAQTVMEFLSATRAECLRVFDVNLREPFYTAESVDGSLRRATVLKMNDGEMPRVLSLAGLSAATEYLAGDEAGRSAALVSDARRLMGTHAGLDLVAVTLGGEGSLLITTGEVERHSGVACVMVDTVGAGDAFTAALTVHRLLGGSLREQNEAANRWGAWVASQAGAMPGLADEQRTAIEGEIARQALVG